LEHDILQSLLKLHIIDLGLGLDLRLGLDSGLGFVLVIGLGVVEGIWIRLIVGVLTCWYLTSTLGLPVFMGCTGSCIGRRLLREMCET